MGPCSVEVDVIRKSRFGNIYHRAERDQSGVERQRVSAVLQGSTSQSTYPAKLYSFDQYFLTAVNSGELPISPLLELSEEQCSVLRIKSPCVVFGRSGTGKTLCCVRRMFSNWQKHVQHPSVYDEISDPADESQRTSDVTSAHTPSSIGAAPIGSSTPRSNVGSTRRRRRQTGSTRDGRTDSVLGRRIDSVLGGRTDSIADRQTESGSHYSDAVAPLDETILTELSDGEQPHGLRQLFVSKNRMLCVFAEKSLLSLIRLVSPVDEDQSSPASLQEMSDSRRPMFLTLRKLCIVLDRSLDGHKLKLEEAIDKLDNRETVLAMLEQEHVEDDTCREVTEAVFCRSNSFDPTAGSELWTAVKRRARNVNAQFQIEKDITAEHVWREIQHVIKGSKEAVEQDSGYLSEEQYVKACGNRSDKKHSRQIYELFLAYDYICRRERNLFDNSDVIKKLLDRLQNTRCQVIDELYIDEVQDLCEAELVLLLRLSCSPRRTFITGDSAQRLEHSAASRTCDLKHVFSSAQQHKLSKRTLTLNYRSHRNILQLGSLLLRVLVEYFPKAISESHQRDIGLSEGQPVQILGASHEQQLISLFNKSFGAHQVVLVPHSHTRAGLPRIVSDSALVLTVHESKGLEYDDVILYNFFTDSKLSEEWKILSYYTNENSAVSQSQGRGSEWHSAQQRAIEPNQFKHFQLEKELRALYTAITRARRTVWIYEQDAEKSEHVRYLLQTFTNARELKPGDDFPTHYFGEKSENYKWIEKGEEFFTVRNYLVAARCFEKGEANEKAADALVFLSRTLNDVDKKEELKRAGRLYRDCQVHYKAGMSFEQAEQWEDAAECYRKQGLLFKAAKCYGSAGLPQQQTAVQMEGGAFKETLNLIRDRALIDELDGCWDRMMKTGRDVGYRTKEEFKEKAAKFHLNLGDSKRAIKFLELLERSPRLRILRAHENVKFAAEIILDLGHVVEAASHLYDHSHFQLATEYLQKNQLDKTELWAKCVLMASRETYMNSDEKSRDETDQSLYSHLPQAIEIFKSQEKVLECEVLRQQLCGFDDKRDSRRDVVRQLDQLKAYSCTLDYCLWLYKEDNDVEMLLELVRNPLRRLVEELVNESLSNSTLGYYGLQFVAHDTELVKVTTNQSFRFPSRDVEELSKSEAARCILKSILDRSFDALGHASTLLETRSTSPGGIDQSQLCLHARSSIILARLAKTLSSKLRHERSLFHKLENLCTSADPEKLVHFVCDLPPSTDTEDCEVNAHVQLRHSLVDKLRLEVVDRCLCGYFNRQYRRYLETIDRHKEALLVELDGRNEDSSVKLDGHNEDSSVKLDGHHEDSSVKLDGHNEALLVKLFHSLIVTGDWHGSKLAKLKGKSERLDTYIQIHKLLRKSEWRKAIKHMLDMCYGICVSLETLNTMTEEVREDQSTTETAEQVEFLLRLHCQLLQLAVPMCCLLYAKTQSNNSRINRRSTVVPKSLLVWCELRLCLLKQEMNVPDVPVEHITDLSRRCASSLLQLHVALRPQETEEGVSTEAFPALNNVCLLLTRALLKNSEQLQLTTPTCTQLESCVNKLTSANPPSVNAAQNV